MPPEARAPLIPYTLERLATINGAPLAPSQRLGETPFVLTRDPGPLQLMVGDFLPQLKFPFPQRLGEAYYHQRD